MGTDYNLKKIYEQMLQGKEIKKDSKPKTLKEAYEKTVNEATAFYAMDMNTGTQAPVYKGLRSLGVVKDEHTSKAIQKTVITNTHESQIPDLMEKAGWVNVASLPAGMIALEFSESNITQNDIEQLISNKENLKGLETKIQEGGDFDYKNSIIEPLKNAKYSVLFDKLYDLTPKVGMASVGKGEVAATLLTSCFKTKVGDIGFGDKKEPFKVEIKGSGGRIGKAPFASQHTSNELANILKATKSQNVENSKLHYDITKIPKKLKQILAPVEHLFSEKYIENVKSLSNNIKFENYNFEKTIENINNYKQKVLPEKLTIKNLIEFFKFNGYFRTLSNNGEVPLSNKDQEALLQYCSGRAELGLKRYLSRLVSKFKSNASANIDPVSLASAPFATSVLHFFLGNGALTVEQMANALVHTRTYGEKGTISNEELKTQCLEVLNSSFEGETYFETLKQRNKRCLDSIIFGITLLVYSKKTNFQYFLILNDNTKNAYSINVTDTTVKSLADLFKNEPRLVLGLDASGDQGGASHITFNG